MCVPVQSGFERSLSMNLFLGLEELEQNALKEIESSDALADLESIRLRLLGKKGELTAALRGMKDISEDQRPAFGKRVNELRDEITQALDTKIGEIKRAEKNARLISEKVDVTLPGKKQRIGGLHPLTRVYYEIRDIFVSMGFDVMDGPEVEYDKYSFELLNIPKEHPARDAQDTFYISEDIVLRPHTSPVQIRTMLAQKPPRRC
jgi:phenylalanyl-tRNA synthetase alpha chain